MNFTKIYLFILFCTTTPYLLFGQNLVLNPSFEYLDDCVTDYGQIDRAIPWFSAGKNVFPSLFNTCSPNQNLSPPNGGLRLTSYQFPRTANGYAGIYVFFNANVGGNEYLEVELEEELISGKDYYLEFFVSPDITRKFDYIYTDQVGLSFSDTLVSAFIEPRKGLKLDYAIENRNGVIKDSMGWTQINGKYKAKGSEKFVIIGNMVDNEEIVVERDRPTSFPDLSYFLIDYVGIYCFDPFPDTAYICGGDTLKYSVDIPNAKHRLNDVAVETLDIIAEGRYILETTISDIVFYDTLVVLNYNKLDSIIMEADACIGEEIVLCAPFGGQFRWSTTDTNSCINVNESEIYSLLVSNECEDYYFEKEINFVDCNCNFNYPNIINSNSNNKTFKINTTQCTDLISVKYFHVYDRWGNLIWTSLDNEIDITLGHPIVTGVYTCVFAYEENDNNRFTIKQLYGSITIL